MKSHSWRAFRVFALTVGAAACLALVCVTVALARNARGVETARGAGTTVRVVEKEMSTSASPTVVKSGDVTFAVRNAGTTEHELVVLAGVGKLPVSHFKAVESRKNLGEVEDILPGKTKSFTLTLKPGKYTLLCNVVGHYMLGMHTVLTVR
jgi:uncharacterized cupredoxin-like copper-binding protein